MDIDEMKTLWAASNSQLEASLRLNTLLLQRANLGKADTSLKRLARGIALELAVNVVAIVVLGAFIAGHVHEPQFLIPALALDIYVIALIVAGGRQLAEIAALDFDEPVVTIQKRLEELKLRRVRTTLWTLLFAPLMWLPLLIVSLRGIFGVNTYAVAGPAWLAANAIFGVAVIPIAIFIAKRYAATLNELPFVRGLADQISGRSLAAAREAVDSIRRFEEE